MSDVIQTSAEGPPVEPSNTTFCHIPARGEPNVYFRVGSDEILRAPLRAPASFVKTSHSTHFLLDVCGFWPISNPFCVHTVRHNMSNSNQHSTSNSFLSMLRHILAEMPLLEVIIIFLHISCIEHFGIFGRKGLLP